MLQVPGNHPFELCWAEHRDHAAECADAPVDRGLPHCCSTQTGKRNVLTSSVYTTSYVQHRTEAGFDAPPGRLNTATILQGPWELFNITHAQTSKLFWNFSEAVTLIRSQQNAGILGRFRLHAHLEVIP